jgi:hypothetical protein
MLKVILPAAIAAVVTGCASLQLNHNFSDLASTSVDLVTSQVLTNLSAFKQNPFATPSQVGVPSGSVTTTNSVTPTVGAPIGSAATITLANSAVAPLFNATTNTHVVPNGTIGVTAADQWSQNYSISPYQDPLQLLRLRALYRFGASLTSKRELLCEYPLVQKAAGSGTSSQPVVNVNFAEGSVETSGSSSKPLIKYQPIDERGPFKCDHYEIWQAGTPDPTLLKLPACVVCDAAADEETTPTVKFEGKAKKDEAEITEVRDSSTFDSPAIKTGDKVTGSCIPASTTIVEIKGTTITLSKPAQTNGDCKFTHAISKLHKLFVNPALSNDWIVFGPLQSGEEEYVKSLGTYKGKEIYVKTDELSQKRFSDFVIRVLEATQMGGTTASGAGGSAGKIQAPASAAITLN